MNIDAHQHFWDFDRERDRWITEEMAAIRRDFTPSDLFAELEKNNIDGSVVVQANPSEAETSFLLAIAKQYDFIKGVVGWIDLTDGKVEEQLQFYKDIAPKLKGFRHTVQDEPDDYFLLREDFCRGVSLLGKYGYTYDILIYARQLPVALQFVEKFPEQRFVIDHIAKPQIKEGVMAPWKKYMQTMASFPNVYCKISGMITEADWKHWTEAELKPYLEVVFEAFGEERLLFGSDWPVCLLAGSYAKVKEIILNFMEDKGGRAVDAVMGGNAAHFYHL